MNRVLDSFQLRAQADDEDWSASNWAAFELGFTWLRAGLEGQIVAQRTVGPPPAFAPDGSAAMSDLRADWMLRAGAAAAGAATEAAAQLRADFDRARSAMAATGRPGTLDQLADIFDLAAFDVDVLLLAMAPQVDATISALYGYVHDRLSAGHATRHLVRLLLAPGPTALRLAQDRLAPEGPLRRHGLIRLEGPEALAPITLDERMIGFLQGRAARDPRLAQVLRGLAGSATPERLVSAAGKLAEQMAAQGVVAAQVIGPRRSGRRAVAAGVAARFGLDPMEVEARALPAGAAERREVLTWLAREAALSGLCLVIDAAPDTLGPEDPAGAVAVLAAREMVESASAVTLVLGEDPTVGLGSLPLARLDAMSREERLWGWTGAFADRVVEPPLLDALVDHFPFSLTQIAEVAVALRDEPVVDRTTLWRACRARATSRLQGLARRVPTTRTWDDLVLPEGVLLDLRAVAAQVARRGLVHGQWGYDALLPRGRGVSCLLAGPSGVGKTLIAEVIAHELDLDLYCIDLATVVSKYIGETEKNLKCIFDAAEDAGAVLFIDEADALFGKRSEVKDSHDRYANIEISYLLQRIEQYSGLAILATNMKSHLDFAFLRRLRYLIDIPFPDFTQRHSLWAKAFPPGAPLGDVDFQRLALLEIAGGNIILIATNAAFIAASEDAPIAMRHVEQAARAEFRKLDRQYSLPAATGGPG